MSATSTPTLDTLTGFDVRRLGEALRSLVAPRRRKQAAALPVCVRQVGLKPGTMAPDFTLRRVGGGQCSLSDHAGRRVLLVFVEGGCETSRDLAPELSRLQRSGEVQVLVVNGCRAHEAALWADDVLAAFSVLVPADDDVAAAYETSATPCAFVIDEQGRIAASGIVNQPRTLSSLLAAAAKH